MEIHTIDCDQLGELRRPRVDRSGLGEVGGERRWSVARITATVQHVPGALADVTKVIGEAGGNLLNIRTVKRAEAFFDMILDVEVDDQPPPVADAGGGAVVELCGRCSAGQAFRRRVVNTDEVLDVFRAAGALLEGHFILSSGLRSPVFLQKALIFKNPVLTERLCEALAEKVRGTLNEMPEAIIAPAMGGVIPGYEMARQMGLESMFVEREEGEFTLRRGFTLEQGARVLMVEDIVTTGLSSRECIGAIEAQTGATVIAGACIFDRSNGEADIGVPLVSLAARKFPAYPADELPPELAAMDAVKPGSRGLK